MLDAGCWVDAMDGGKGWIPRIVVTRSLEFVLEYGIL